MNSNDPPIALEDDQSVLAENVEYTRSTLGERRRGAAALTDAPTAPLVNPGSVPFLYRHLPLSDETKAELWALVVSPGMAGTAKFVRKDTEWRASPIADPIDLTEGYQYQVQAASLHGKLFLAYKSNQDRLHVWDESVIRRSGLLEPLPPTVADSSAVGTFASSRYYRVRYVSVGTVPLSVPVDGTREITPFSSRTYTLKATDASGASVSQSVDVTVTDGRPISFAERRSEASESVEFTPSGSNSGAVITKPAAVDESETHWEVQASDATEWNYYTLRRLPVGTLTYTDTTDLTRGIAHVGILQKTQETTHRYTRHGSLL